MKIVRKAKLTEVPHIKALLDSAAESGNILRRPLMELYENVRDFYIYVDEQGVAGCCALHIDMADLAEVRSLVVRQDLRKSGIGARLLNACLDEARGLNINRVYALTRSVGFFTALGFSEIDKKELPHKVFTDCLKCPSFPDCDEVAMIRNLDDADTGRQSETAPMGQAELQGVLGFIGFGNMGGAIAKGLIAARTIPAGRIRIHDVAADKAESAAALGIQICQSPAEVLRGCDTVVLAVKPQTMGEALDQLKPHFVPATLVITIAAGISTGFIQERLGGQARVVRVMPNTPALVSEGAAGIAAGALATDQDLVTARTIFEAVGIAEIVPESLIDVVTGLSGSGPAYFFNMVECLVRAAVAHGLDEESAVRLAGQTLLGSGKLMMETGESPSILRERVTSKGGTTAAALEAFKTGGLESVVKAGVDAAVARARELGK